ncbi:MAG: hypothetical protein R2844_03960 [Caldilineales bacterium]
MLLVSACGGVDSDDAPAATAPQAAVVDTLDDAGAVSSLYSPLTIHAARETRQVTPDSDEVFELAVANESQQDVPVVFVLEHADGQRWRTSLCVAEQCILGDGSDTSVTDPVVLSSLLEQPFQAHVFVDADAKTGQSTTLTLRVEPQVAGIAPQQVLISAEVVRP